MVASLAGGNGFAAVASRSRLAENGRAIMAQGRFVQEEAGEKYMLVLPVATVA